MFKKIAFAGALAAAAMVGAPAHAAAVIYLTDDGMNGDQTIELVAGTNSATGGFSFQVTEDDEGAGFTATYTFNNTVYDPAAGQATLIFTVGGGSDLSFTDATLAGGAGQLVVNNDPGFPGATVFVFNSPIPLGSNTLTFSGNLLGGGTSDTASGTLTLTAVPEPSTWAMFILGFGALGFAMRRRNAIVTATKATLNFA